MSATPAGRAPATAVQGRRDRVWWLACSTAVAVSILSVLVLHSARATARLGDICSRVHAAPPALEQPASVSPTEQPASTASPSTSPDASSASADWVNPVLAPPDVVSVAALPDPNNEPAGLVADCAGDMWFFEVGGSDQGTAPSIDRISPDGTLTRFPVQPDPDPQAGNLKAFSAITLGPDANVWFTDASANQVVRVGQDGTMTTFTPPTPDAGPRAITAGPDGALWVVEALTGSIARLSTDGAWREFPLPGGPDAAPSAIVTGGDGALYFTVRQNNSVGRMTTDGQSRLTALPVPGSGPDAIAAAQDGSLWLVEDNRQRVAHLTTTGELTEYLMPRADPDVPSRPAFPVVLRDGTVWVVDPGNRGFDVIDPDGHVGVHVNAGVQPGPSAQGLDGDIWFIDAGGGGIGRVELPGSAPALTPTPIVRVETASPPQVAGS